MDNNSNSQQPKKEMSANDLLKKLKANIESTQKVDDEPQITGNFEKTQPDNLSVVKEKEINKTKPSLKRPQEIDESEPTKEIPKINVAGTDSVNDDDLDIDAMIKRFAPDTLGNLDMPEDTGILKEDESESEEEVVDDRYQRFAPKKKPNDGKNPDIEKRIKAAEAYMKNMPETNDENTADDLIDEVHKKPEIDDVDLNLMIAFGMDDELVQRVGIEKVNEIESDIDKTFEHITEKTIQTGVMEKETFEYREAAQTKAILQNYKKAYHAILIRFGICFILLIFTFLYENIGLFGGNLPSPVHPDVYPVIHIMINLQFLVLAAALIYKPLYNGMLGLIKFKPIPESVTFVILLFTLAYHIVLCFINVGSGVKLFNFPVVVCIFMTLIHEFMNLKRELYGFNIIASKRNKYVTVQINPNKAERESETFYEFLPQNPLLLKIKKTPFIDGFYKRMSGYSKSKKILNVIIPIIVLLTLIFFGIAYFFKPENELYVSIQIAYMMMIICTPFSLFITYSYPFYKASKEAYENDSAIIGEVSLDEYSSAAAITFDDKDVFPSYSVKIKNMKGYGNNRIDQVVYNAASLFIRLGGPLSDELALATVEVGHSENVELIEVADDGIEAVVDDSRIFVGKASYLRRNEFEPINPGEDGKLESGGDLSVMYIVCNNEVSAKMYIQYVIDPDFEFIIRQLYKSGMCIGIKTYDPNINDSMLSSRVRLSKYPVKIIRCRSLEDQIETESHIESGIVSKNSPKSLLQTLTLCDKVLQTIKANLVIKIVVMMISIIIMTALMMLNMSDGVNSFYIALYQLFWSIPMVIIAKLLI
jgi:hypothetical protein